MLLSCLVLTPFHPELVLAILVHQFDFLLPLNAFQSCCFRRYGVAHRGLQSPRCPSYGNWWEYVLHLTLATLIGSLKPNTSRHLQRYNYWHDRKCFDREVGMEPVWERGLKEAGKEEFACRFGCIITHCRRAGFWEGRFDGQLG